MSKLVIRGGTLVTPEKAEPGEILVHGETIAAVGPSVSAPRDAEVLDASGLLLFPGLIDPHVHLREPGGAHKEDFLTGTSAALAGGFTTVLAMPNTSPPLTSREAIARAASLAAEKAVCDVGFFVGATPDNVMEAAQAAEAGQAVGLKLYMGSSTGDLLVADTAAQLAHFRTYRGVIAVHAEDEEAVRHFADNGLRRPPFCAALAVAKALAVAEQTGCRLHICHVSTAGEVQLIRAAKGRGVKVTCEVTPHHLFLTAEDEERLGSLGRMNPPLRAREEVEALWDNLDLFDCVATDHAPHTLDEKEGDSPPAGVPGLETALPLMLTAVQEGKLALTDVARLMAAGPAEVFGLAKGRLEPRCDADLTLVDPQAEWTIGDVPLLTKCGWTPFAGRRVRGRVQRVVLRGRQGYAEREVVAAAGAGRVIGGPTA